MGNISMERIGMYATMLWISVGVFVAAFWAVVEILK